MISESFHHSICIHARNLCLSVVMLQSCLCVRQTGVKLSSIFRRFKFHAYYSCIKLWFEFHYKQTHVQSHTWTHSRFIYMTSTSSTLGVMTAARLMYEHTHNTQTRNTPHKHTRTLSESVFSYWVQLWKLMVCLSEILLETGKAPETLNILHSQNRALIRT